MASKRNLKKDINYLVDEVIGTCMMRQTIDDKKIQDELDTIIRETLEFREDMLSKVNNPQTGDNSKKSIRIYYRALYEELLQKVNGIFDRIYAITE